MSFPDLLQEKFVQMGFSPQRIGGADHMVQGKLHFKYWQGDLIAMQAPGYGPADEIFTRVAPDPYDPELVTLISDAAEAVPGFGIKLGEYIAEETFRHAARHMLSRQFPLSHAHLGAVERALLNVPGYPTRGNYIRFKRVGGSVPAWTPILEGETSPLNGREYSLRELTQFSTITIYITNSQAHLAMEHCLGLIVERSTRTCSH